MDKPKPGERFAGPGLTVLVVIKVEQDPADKTDYVIYREEGTSRTWEMRLTEWNKLHSPTPPVRPSWDDYFTQMAHLVSTRSTCDRKHVGAVLVLDRRVIATGYNGSPPGMPHCDDVGHDLVLLADGRENCVRTIHAEENALLQAASFGVGVSGSTLYTNTYPCWPCAKHLIGAGVVMLVVDTDYNNDPRVEEAFRAKGVRLERAGKKEEEKEEF